MGTEVTLRSTGEEMCKVRHGVEKRQEVCFTEQG